jgi:predicted hydrolase (HD superfamily)
VCHAVLCHNEAHGVPCETLLDKALFCTDPFTSLITAGALIRQEKSLAGLSTESLKKRFKEKRFAAGASRGGIATCEQIDLSLDEFLTLGLDAMKGIATDLGL